MNKCTRKQCPFIGVKSCEMKDCPYRTEYGWITCSERLPEADGRYLVTSTKWGECETTIDVFYNGDWIGDVKPIAWQRLPEPYKEGTDE